MNRLCTCGHTLQCEPGSARVLVLAVALFASFSDAFVFAPCMRSSHLVQPVLVSLTLPSSSFVFFPLFHATAVFPLTIKQAHPEVPHRPPPRCCRQGEGCGPRRGRRCRAPRLVPRHPRPRSPRRHSPVRLRLRPPQPRCVTTSPPRTNMGARHLRTVPLFFAFPPAFFFGEGQRWNRLPGRCSVHLRKIALSKRER